MQRRGTVSPEKNSGRLGKKLVLALDFGWRRDTTPESRKNWIAAPDRLAALNPAMVVAGHKKPGAPDSPSTIPALGSQSVVVDVRIPAAITYINR